MMSGLLYTLLRPELARSRMVQLLIPPSEPKSLRKGLRQKSLRWREAVRRFVQRQEAAGRSRMGPRAKGRMRLP